MHGRACRPCAARARARPACAPAHGPPARLHTARHQRPDTAASKEPRGAQGAGPGRDLEQRLKAQEDWKQSQDRSARTEAAWKQNQELFRMQQQSKARPLMIELFLSNPTFAIRACAVDGSACAAAVCTARQPGAAGRPHVYFVGGTLTPGVPAGAEHVHTGPRAARRLCSNPSRASVPVSCEP